jgi:hypothetical protein
VTTTNSYTGVTAGQTTGVAAAVDAAITAVDALASAPDPWTSTVGGTGWALGNGTLTSEYSRIGDLVLFNISITWGSTSTYGSASLTLSLPATPGAAGMAVCRAGDASAAASYGGQSIIATSGVTTPLFTPAAAGGASRGAISTVPFAWTTSDTLVVTGWFWV